MDECLYLATVELKDAVFVRADGVEVRAKTPVRIEAETGKCGG